jgi:hypothetical protein
MQQTCLLDMTCVCQSNKHISSNVSIYGGQKPNTHCNALSKNVRPPTHNKERQQWAVCWLPSCKMGRMKSDASCHININTVSVNNTRRNHSSACSPNTGTQQHAQDVTSHNYKHHILRATRHTFPRNIMYKTLLILKSEGASSTSTILYFSKLAF